MEETYICKYCGKICKNKNSLALHEIRCKENPNKISLPQSNFIKYNENVKAGIVEKTHTNQYDKSKDTGIPFILSEESRRNIGNGWRGKKHTEELKEKISKGIRKAIKEHPESYSSTNISGRVKKYEYNGVKLDGLWELDVAKYLDKNNIKWTRPMIGIPYIWKEKLHSYFPDFYLNEYDTYIEVKGYLYNKEKDDIKWSSISHLIVIMLKEIEKIRKNQYNIFDYILL